MASPYVIVIDTLCTGWTCERNADTGEPVTYPTLEAACAEILSDAQDLWDNQDPDDLEGEARPETALDCEAFAVPLAEYIEGRKTVFTFDGLHVVGTIPEAPSPDPD